MFVNNGKYRRSIFQLRKFIDSIESYTGGFPVFVNIKNSFAEYSDLTDEAFLSLSNVEYQTRLSAFYAYMSLMHPLFNPSLHIPLLSNAAVNSHGIDSDACPIDLPSASRVQLILEVVYRVDGENKFVEVYGKLADANGNDVPAIQDFTFDFIEKLIEGIPEEDWEVINGELKQAIIIQGNSSVLLVPEFQYKGSTLDILRSLQIILIPLNEEEIYYLGNPNKFTISVNDPCFLFNHIASLDQAYQEMILASTAQEKISSGEGIKLLGKRDYIFTFEPDQPKRPVFIYPKSWGKLTEIEFVQGPNLNVINDGAFIFNDSEPFEYPLQIDGEVINFYVYASKAMIIYPYRVEYIFKFDMTIPLVEDANDSFPYDLPFDLSITTIIN